MLPSLARLHVGVSSAGPPASNVRIKRFLEAKHVGGAAEANNESRPSEWWNTIIANKALLNEMPIEMLEGVLKYIHEPLELRNAGLTLVGHGGEHARLGEYLLKEAKSLFHAAKALGLEEEAKHGTLKLKRSLDLGKPPTGNSGMEKLSLMIGKGSLASLDQLYLFSSNIGNAGMIAFSEAIEPTDKFPMGSLVKLEGLYLNSNQISDDGMKAFSTAIASGSLPKLEMLGLAANQIGYEGITAFSTAIASRSMAKLKMLWFAGNKIGDAGMIALAEALKPTDKSPMGSLPKLTHLGLSINEIKDAGMIKLSEAIGKGSLAKLKILRLDNNQIGNAGMAAFSTAIASGSLASLLELRMHSNEIGEAGMAAFVEALESTPENPLGSLANLEELSLQYNQIDDAGVTALASAVSRDLLVSLSVLWVIAGGTVEHTFLKAACEIRGITFRWVHN